MAKIQELFDRNTGEAIYPRTAAQAVYDAEGRDLETRLAAEATNTDEKLADYSTTDEVKGFIETLTEEISDSLASGDFGASVAGNSGFVERLLSHEEDYDGFIWRLSHDTYFGEKLGSALFGPGDPSNDRLAQTLAYQSGMSGLASNFAFYNALCNNPSFYTSLGVRLIGDSSTRYYWAQALATNSPLATGLVYYSGFYNSLASNSTFVAGFYRTLSSYSGFTAALDKKQNALTVSDDLKLTPEGALSLTDAAKMRQFIEMFNEAAGEDGYARMENGVFDCKLNGVPLTYEEAIGVYASYPLCKHRNPTRQAMFAGTRDKTLFPINTDSFLATNYIEAFTGCSNLVAIKFITASNNPIVAISGAQNMFKNCMGLKYIYGALAFTSNVNVSGAFDFCLNLEEVRIKNLAKSLNLASSPKLSFDSLAFMVQYAANTTAITVTVHADVFAKLTGDNTNEAAAALTEEELARWAQVLTDALEKNITFATV